MTDVSSIVHLRSARGTSRLLRALRRLGPKGFSKLLAYNVWLLLSGRAGEHRYAYDDSWDRAHRVDTAGTLEVDEIDAPAAAKAGAVRYEPTPPECFSFLIAEAGVSDPARFSFVDLGSGKGRVAMLAALAGFGKVAAVEIGADLHRIAAENFRRLRAGQDLAPITAVHGDARSHPWGAEPTILFLNNPFSGEVLDDVLDRIESSLAETPREFVLVYYHCNHVDRVEARDGWQLLGRGHWENQRHQYALFSWDGQAG